MDLLDGFLIICFISLQTSESCQARTFGQQNMDQRYGGYHAPSVPSRIQSQQYKKDNNPVISVLVKSVDEVASRRYNQSYHNEIVYYHVGDNNLISCEQESEKYTLSWRQQAGDVSILFIPYNAKRITINIILERFDHDTEFTCTAFEDATLTTAIYSISFKFNNTQLDSSKNIDPPNFTSDPQCLLSDHQAMPYVIIDDTLHNDSSTYPNDTTKVCIQRYCNATDLSHIYITRRVTYMNYLKPENEVQRLDKNKDLLAKIGDSNGEHPENERDYKKVWIAAGGGTVAALILLIIIIIIWKRKRRSSTDVADPLYATAQELNRVVYADLDMVRGSTFSQNREDVTPYAQVIGIIKPKKKT